MIIPGFAFVALCLRNFIFFFIIIIWGKEVLMEHRLVIPRNYPRFVHPPYGGFPISPSQGSGLNPLPGIYLLALFYLLCQLPSD